jgi:hypothetical protein
MVEAPARDGIYSLLATLRRVGTFVVQPARRFLVVNSSIRRLNCYFVGARQDFFSVFPDYFSSLQNVFLHGYTRLKR